MGGAAVAAFAVVATVIGTAGAAPVPAKAKPWNPPRNVKQLDFVGGKTAPGVVPDSYIVILKNHPSVTSTNTTTAASGLTAKYGGTVTHTYSAALHGYAAHMTAAQANALKANPDVASVRPNHIMRITDTEIDPPWGLDRIDQPVLPLDHGYTATPGGTVVHAYVIDSGVHISHTDFGGRASYGFDFVDNDAVAEDCPVADPDPTKVGTGHGTHVAGTIGGTNFGVDKNVQIVAVRVMRCNGSGDEATIAASIDWVTKNAVKPAVANLSIGGDPSTLIDTAVRNSIAAGITYSIAAGNGDPVRHVGIDACTQSPSDVTEAIVASATDEGDVRAPFANFGNCVSVFAPGLDVVSAWFGDNTSAAIASGTSMAAPHVAGAAALLLTAHPDWTPAQVKAAVVGGAVSGAVHNAGPNSPDKLLNTAGTTPIAAPVSLLAQADNRWVTSDASGTQPLIASRMSAFGWEQFDAVDQGNGFVALRAKSNGKFVTAEAGGAQPLIANRSAAAGWELFKFVPQSDGSFAIQANANGRFVTAEAAGGKALIANRTSVGTWEKFYKMAPPGVFALAAFVNQKVVTAEAAGTKPLIANRDSISAWEEFEQIDVGNGNFALRSHANGLFVTADLNHGGTLIANRTAIGTWETFTLLHIGNGRVGLGALANKMIVTAEAAGAQPLIANRTQIGTWETFFFIV